MLRTRGDEKQLKETCLSKKCFLSQRLNINQFLNEVKNEKPGKRHFL